MKRKGLIQISFVLALENGKEINGKKGILQRTNVFLLDLKNREETNKKKSAIQRIIVFFGLIKYMEKKVMKRKGFIENSCVLA